MTEYDNTNRGSIWKNENQRPGKQDADFTGSINIEGREFWLNGWRRKEGAGPRSPAMTFTVRPKDGKQKDDRISTGRHSVQPGGKVARDNSDMNDDIPF